MSTPLINMLSGQRVLVTGATGSIGSAIVRELVKDKGGVCDRVIAFSRDEYKQHEMRQGLYGPIDFVIGDVRSFDSLNNALRGVNYCFHTAAMKHVSICEENPFEAVQTNVIGTENLINAAIANKVYRVLAISTDKAVEPVSVLGSTKLLMEKLIKAKSSYTTKLSSIRFGNILNSRGSAIPLWKKQIEDGGPITVTDANATRYFIEIDEVVRACFQAMEVMRGGEIFVVNCDKPKRIMDIVNEIRGEVSIEITGLRPGERLHEELFTAGENDSKVKMTDWLWAV